MYRFHYQDGENPNFRGDINVWTDVERDSCSGDAVFRDFSGVFYGTRQLSEVLKIVDSYGYKLKSISRA